MLDAFDNRTKRTNVKFLAAVSTGKLLINTFEGVTLTHFGMKLCRKNDG